MHPLLPLLRRQYAHLAKDFLGPMIEALNAGRASCDGDLDKLLIVLVVGMRTAEDKRILDVAWEEALSGALEAYPSLSTNVRSIADSTGIPRESVRRKVAALVETGWIDRDGHSLSITPEASRRLTDFRECLFQMALRYAQMIQALDPQDR